MKKISTALLILMTIFIASCGGDKNSSGSSSSNALNGTYEGYYNPQDHSIELNGTTYPANSQHAQVMNMALSQARATNVMPIYINGVYKFRGRFTTTTNTVTQNPYTGMNAGYQGGYNSGYNGGFNGGMNGGFNAGYNPGYVQPAITITSVVFY